jgi:hypothetical protein
MRCNKCGSDNSDDRRVCAVCGHKLQSGRGGPEDAGETGETGEAGASGLTGPTTATDLKAPGQGSSGRGSEGDRPEIAPDRRLERDASRLLDFQGWSSPLRGLGPYLEACLYGGLLAAGVGVCLLTGVLWPLYPLLAVLAVAAWLRRL